MKSVHLSFIAGLAGSSLSLSTPAAAQRPESPDAAEASFREGSALFAEGKVHLACDKFAESLRLDAAPGTLKNLALCHVADGRTASAWREYLELASLATTAGVKKAAQEARAQASMLEKKLSRVTITVPDGVPIATLEVDGVPIDVAELHAPLPLDVGPHTLHVVDAQGHDVRVPASVPAGPSDTAILVTWPAVTSPPPPPASPKPEPAPFPARPIGWSLVALGAVGVTVGSGLGLAAYAHRNDHPNDDAFRDATASSICFAVGLASAVAGGVVLWRARPTPPAALRLAPLAGPHLAGIAAGATW